MPAIDIILATMSMGPALIGEEMDDSVDLTLGDMFHHIAVYWGLCLQFPSWIHAFKFVRKKYAALITIRR